MAIPGSASPSASDGSSPVPSSAGGPDRPELFAGGNGPLGCAVVLRDPNDARRDGLRWADVDLEAGAASDWTTETGNLHFLDHGFDDHGFDDHGFDDHGFDDHGFDDHDFDDHGFDDHDFDDHDLDDYGTEIITLDAGYEHRDG